MKNLTHIFGCPRSGTTWLWSLLVHNKDITPFTMSSPKNGIYRTSESGYILYNKISEVKEFCKKHKYVIEKTPLHTLHYKKIIQNFPESKNILIVRHPISVYFSYHKSKIQSLPNTKQAIINNIKSYFLLYPDIKEHSLTIKYEDLNDNTEAVLNKVFDYIGIEKGEYENFNTQNIVNLPHVFRKGKNFSFQEELSEGEINELRNIFKEEIEFWKST